MSEASSLSGFEVRQLHCIVIFNLLLGLSLLYLSVQLLRTLAMCCTTVASGGYLQERPGAAALTPALIIRQNSK